MKLAGWITGLLALLLALFSTVNAQHLNAENQYDRFQFELNGGASMATYELGGANLNTGGGFEALFHYRIKRNIGTYAGWGWNHFSADQSFAGENMDFEETGYIFGLQYNAPLSFIPFNYYLRAGGLYNHIEIENSKGDIVEDSGHGLGWQVAGGLQMPLSNKWILQPGFKFNALSRQLKTDASYGNKQLDLNYLTFRIGFARSF